MFCRKCGKEITGAGKFCPHCGTACMQTAEEASEEDISSGRASFPRRWRIAAAILLVCCALGILLTVLGRFVSEYRYRRQLSLGDHYLQEMDYEAAVSAYEKAIQIDPKQEDAYLKAARAWLDIGETEEAVILLETGLEAVGTGNMSDLREEAEKIRQEANSQEEEKEEQKSAMTEEGLEYTEASERTELDEENVYALYNRLNPLLAWGDDYYGDKDILGEMGNVGNRQEFANICFAYLKQLCPEASVENYVEHYTSYNTVFGDGAFSLEVDGSIEAMEAIDRARAQQELEKDWCRNLDLSGEEYTYEVVGHSGWRLTDAYKLEEINKTLKDYLGEYFVEFTAKELEEYNFLYDPENQIICRKTRESMYFTVETYFEFVHNYVREAYKEGEKYYIRIQHLRLSLNEDGYLSSETAQWCSYEEARQYQGDKSVKWVLVPVWGKHGHVCEVPLFCYGQPIPLLYAHNPISSSSASNEDYDLGVCGFIDFRNRELDWKYDPSIGDGEIIRYLHEEDAFKCVQANAEELMDPENVFHSCLQMEYEVTFVLENREGTYCITEILR